MRFAGAETPAETLQRRVLAPLFTTGPQYKWLVFFLAAVVAWGVYAYIVQITYGLLVTGMRDVVMWGLYLVNFVFFIGISHAGTLISGILRVTHAGWRTPVTRMAELITVVAISIGALMPIIDLGRPDRVWHMIWFGRLQSPLLWDIVSITSYLTGSLIYLYLPTIPDMAYMRDRLANAASSFRYKFYAFLAVGWRNTADQRRRLDKAIGIMALTIIPVAISVHTVVSFVFSMTLRPGWDSTVFGLYFVIGAIFSGIATILIVMAIFRKLYHFEDLITEKHFRYLSYLLLTTLLLYIYLTVCEYLTVVYKLQGETPVLLNTLWTGSNAAWFWLFAVAGLVIPGILIVVRRGPLIPRVVTAAILVNIGMWLKRFVIIVPSLEVPLMPFEFGAYTPTWVEWSIMLAAFAAFVLIFTLAAKVVPLISIWEVAEEQEKERAEHAPASEAKQQPAVPPSPLTRRQM